MSKAITQAAYYAAKVKADNGDTLGAWQTLANAGDNYARAGARIVDPNGDSFIKSLVKETWESSVGIEVYDAKFTAVATAHLSGYLAIIESNINNRHSATLPTTLQIEESYKDALDASEVSHNASVDAIINSVGGISPHWANLLDLFDGDWSNIYDVDASRISSEHAIYSTYTPAEAVTNLVRIFTNASASELTDDAPDAGGVGINPDGGGGDGPPDSDRPSRPGNAFTDFVGKLLGGVVQGKFTEAAAAALGLPGAVVALGIGFVSSKFGGGDSSASPDSEADPYSGYAPDEGYGPDNGHTDSETDETDPYSGYAPDEGYGPDNGHTESEAGDTDRFGGYGPDQGYGPDNGHTDSETGGGGDDDGDSDSGSTDGDYGHDDSDNDSHYGGGGDSSNDNDGDSDGGSSSSGGNGATRGGDAGDGTRGGSSSSGNSRGNGLGGGRGDGNGGYGGGGNNGGDSGGGGFKPIALDLDGDGVELVSLDESTAFYDINADGYSYNLGWAAADDGLLAYDKNGDGKINRKDEISFVDYVPGARTDLQGLRHFDSNGDGVLDASDGEFSKFRVWQDANQNGISDAGELRTLRQAGISAIELNYAPGDDREPSMRAGNLIAGEGRYRKTDGATGVFADAAFTTSAFGFRVTGDNLEFKGADEQGAVYVASADANAGVEMNFADAAHAAHIGAIGGAHADVLNGAGVSRDLLLLGGDGADQLTGGGGADWLLGGEGADTLRGGNGHDVLFFDAHDNVHGGAGYDVGVVSDDAGGMTVSLDDAGLEALYGGDGDDYLHNYASRQSVLIDGGGGHDEIRGSDNADLLSGGGGDDNIIGQQGDDVLLGGDGNDTIEGRKGNDVLAGGAGNDALSGGLGDDVYVFNRGDGSDWIRSRSEEGGADVLRFGDDIRVMDLLLQRSGDDLLVGVGDGSARNSVFGMDDNLRIQNWFTQHGMLEHFAFAGNLRLPVADVVEQLDVGHSAESAVGLSGLSVGPFKFGGDGVDRLLGTNGNDRLEGYDGDDGLFGLGGNDTLIGGDGADLLRGSAGDDVVLGGDGNDSLAGDGGADVLRGGDGDDWLYFDAHDNVHGGAGYDVGVVWDDADNITVSLDDAGLEALYGGDGNEHLHNYASQHKVTIYGRGGNDRIRGSDSADKLSGGDGNDHIIGHQGDDALRGDDGSDTIEGRKGNDVLTGGRGNDTLYGGYGDDVFVFNRGDGSDQISADGWAGDGGIDVLQFGAGITASDVRLRQDGNDLLVEVEGGTTGAADSVRIQNGFARRDVVEYFAFAGDSLVYAMAEFDPAQTGVHNIRPQTRADINAAWSTSLAPAA